MSQPKEKQEAKAKQEQPPCPFCDCELMFRKDCRCALPWHVFCDNCEIVDTIFKTKAEARKAVSSLKLVDRLVKEAVEVEREVWRDKQWWRQESIMTEPKTSQQLNEAVAERLGLKSGYTSAGIFICGEFGRKPFDPATKLETAVWALKRICRKPGWDYQIEGHFTGTVECRIYHFTDLVAKGIVRDGNDCVAICKAIVAVDAEREASHRAMMPTGVNPANDPAEAISVLVKLCTNNKWNYGIRGYWPGSVVCRLYRHISDFTDAEMLSEGRATDHNVFEAISRAIAGTPNE